LVSTQPRGAIEVLAPGLLSTVQDTRGRPGFGGLGIAAGGALDWFSAEAANSLIDNSTDAALLELTLEGPALRFNSATACALAGADLSATLDGLPLSCAGSFFARGGSVLRFGDRRRGVRAYLAVAGGLMVPPVLESRATDLTAGFGGLAGRRLRAGDRLPYDLISDPLLLAGRSLGEASWPMAGPEVAVRVLAGPHLHRFEPGALESLCAEPWRISDQADRMGYRLTGGASLRHVGGADVASLGLPIGAIQVPGDGRPITLLVDHQPTGGYPVLACVIRADLPLLAQRQTGDTVRFAITTQEQAITALRDRRALLGAVHHEVVWDDLRSAGAHL
jgi:antagonist of KipI